MTQTKPETEERPNIARMFGRIVNWYDPLNRILSLGLDQVWRKKLANEVFANRVPLPSYAEKRVLDLAAGTLDVSLALQRRYPGVEVLAMDFCLPMLQRGTTKIDPGKPIHTVAADARALPLPDACVDGITIAFGIRNITPRSAAFAEMARVLVPGGRLCILEFGTGRQRIWMGIYNFYLKYVLPVLGRISGNASAYTYLAQSIIAFPTAEALCEELREAGFTHVRYIPLSSGIVCLHIAEKI